MLEYSLAHLEEIMRAVTKACAIPRVKVNGFFLTNTKYIRGRNMMEWMASLWMENIF